ncbi:MAG: mercuric transport protein [Vicinamibacteria bacterium]|jgi:mercuric ion transport protein|nr:mercuric transport protein [Vicinamibacteria bacterium]
MKIERATAAGSVVSAFLASACCIGPVVFAMLGLSGAAMAHRLEPFRPYLLLLTYTLLAAAFLRTYRRPPAACGPDGACEMPGVNRLGKAVLWVAAAVVVFATTFPYYAEYLPL